jgi:hypothetical protein
MQLETKHRMQFSVLACLETTIATCTAIYLTYSFDLWAIFIWFSTIAPFFLLRTKQSDAMAQRLWHLIRRKQPKFKSTPEVDPEAFRQHPTLVAAQNGSDQGLQFAFVINLIFVAIGVAVQCIFYVGLLMVSVPIRFLSVAITTVVHPMVTLNSIPKNFKEVCFYVNSSYPLELIPGVRKLPITPYLRDNYGLSGQVSISMLPRCVKYLPIVAVLATILAVMPIGWARAAFAFIAVLVWPKLLLAAVELLLTLHLIICVFLRLNLKMTAICWWPLAWVASDIDLTTEPIRTVLKRITTLESYSVRRTIALIFGVLLFTKLGFQFIANDLLVRYLSWSWIPKLLRDWFGVDEFPSWQLATLAGCTLTWIAYFYADTELFKIDHGQSVSESSIRTRLTVLKAVGWILAVFTGLINVHFLYEHAETLPHLRIKWLPDDFLNNVLFFLNNLFKSD